MTEQRHEQPQTAERHHPRRGAVVANPSSTPELVQAASAIARHGLLERYHAPVATTARQEAALRRYLPAALSRPLLAELRRRSLPSGVPEDRLQRTATLADIARVAGARMHAHRWQMALIERHFARFDIGVERHLTRRDGALLAALGTTPRAVRRANQLGVPVLLDVLVAHSAWMRQTMREEARLVPDYAVTLQGHDLSDSMLATHAECFRRADRLLVLSSHERATLIDHGVDEARMIYTPLGVDLELFRPMPRIDDGVFRVVFVGQITQRKGLSYLVEAFQRLRLPRSELMLVGNVVGSDAPWRSVPGIRHVSAVARNELPALYATTDVYVLPSLAEGFPLTQMEAMAMGLPVIVSEHTSAHDVITDGHDGWIVPIRDADAIAQRLRILHDDPDLRVRVGAAARARAEQFSWHRYQELVASIVKDVLR